MNRYRSSLCVLKPIIGRSVVLRNATTNKNYFVSTAATLVTKNFKNAFPEKYERKGVQHEIGCINKCKNNEDL